MLTYASPQYRELCRAGGVLGSRLEEVLGERRRESASEHDIRVDVWLPPLDDDGAWIDFLDRVDRCICGVPKFGEIAILAHFRAEHEVARGERRSIVTGAPP